MLIKSNRFTWVVAVQKAHALSLCNPTLTFHTVSTDNDEDTWLIADTQGVDAIAAKGEAFMIGSTHFQGRRGSF